MATRFYFPSGKACPITLPTGVVPQWWDVPSTTYRGLALAKTGSSFVTWTGPVEDTVNNPYGEIDCARIYVSPALVGSGTIGGSGVSIKGQFRAMMSPGADLGEYIYCYVVSNDGTVQRGGANHWLYAQGNSGPSGDMSSSSTLTNMKWCMGFNWNNLLSIPYQDGDRIVIEIGISDNNPVVGSYGTIEFGDGAASDLPEDYTTTTQLNPWIELSQTLTFAAEGPAPVVITTHGGVEVGGDNTPQFSGRTVVTPSTGSPAQGSSIGGVVVGGSNTPIFITPGIYQVPTRGGVVIGGFTLPVFSKPGVFKVATQGGVVVGGRPVPVFVNPQALPNVYTIVTSGGIVVGGGGIGAAVPKFIVPGVYVAEVSGGIKVSGPALSGVLFIQPAAPPLSTLTSRGGIEVGGETVPVFSVPSVYVVPVDPRIVACLYVGGGGGPIFIRPQVFVAPQSDGGILVGGASEVVAGPFETWVLDGKNYEPSIFSGYEFNSFALYQGKPYGAGENGLYLLEGPDDDGMLIHPGVRIGPFNLATDRYKRLRSLRLGDCGSNTQVGVTIGSKTGYFEVEGEGRVPVSQDLEGREITLDISDFSSLSQAEIIPLILGRR